MSRRYGALWIWSTVLIIVGVVGVVFVVIGTIVTIVEAVAVGQALSILLIGCALAALFASWPTALGRGSRELADVAEYVQGQQGGVR